MTRIITITNCNRMNHEIWLSEWLYHPLMKYQSISYCQWTLVIYPEAYVIPGWEYWLSLLMQMFFHTNGNMLAQMLEHGKCWAYSAVTYFFVNPFSFQRATSMKPVACMTRIITRDTGCISVPPPVPQFDPRPRGFLNQRHLRLWRWLELRKRQVLGRPGMADGDLAESFSYQKQKSSVITSKKNWLLSKFTCH